MKELYISHGYQNTVGEIYLSENEALGFVRGEDGILVELFEELTSKYLRFDISENIYMRVIKIKSDNKIKEIFIPIGYSSYKTVKLNNPGDVFYMPIDSGSRLTREMWTILSIEEIREKVNVNQVYCGDF